MSGLSGDAASALVLAREADDRFWASGRDSLKHRQERDRALAAALDAGISREQLADELGVTIDDIERMVRAAQV